MCPITASMAQRRRYHQPETRSAKILPPKCDHEARYRYGDSCTPSLTEACPIDLVRARCQRRRARGQLVNLLCKSISWAAADAPWFPVDATAMPRAPFATAVDTMH